MVGTSSAVKISLTSSFVKGILTPTLTPMPYSARIGKRSK